MISTYTTQNCIINITHPTKNSPYFTFNVVHQSKTHNYGGVQNKCFSIQEAYKRAWWRAKWLNEGKNPYTLPTIL